MPPVQQEGKGRETGIYTHIPLHHTRHGRPAAGAQLSRRRLGRGPAALPRPPHGRPQKATFYREVLARLGANNLVDHRPTPLAVAELYAQHLDDPALEAAGRADEAAVEGDPALRAFWIEVHRQVEALGQTPRGGDAER